MLSNPPCDKSWKTYLKQIKADIYPLEQKTDELLEQIAREVE